MLYHKKKISAGRKIQKSRPRYDALGKLPPEEKVRLLLRNQPHWSVILRACIITLQQHKDKKHFAGAWVMQLLRADGITPPNNLRTLSAIRLIHVDKKTRCGNRAYYTMPDVKAITKVLKDLKR